MRLLIVDDHEVVRRGVRSLLLEQSEFEVCGEAVDGQDALDKARELKPDLIVMDVSMPRLSGLEATRQVRSIIPDCEVLILSQHENPEMARQALKAGARGYVVKGSISKDLLSAISKVSRREYFFDPAILDQTPSTHIDIREILQRSAAFEHALRQSEQLYRSTFEMAGLGIAHVSPDGRYLRVNKKVCKVLGYSEAELLSLTVQDITHPDDLEADLAQREQVRTGTLASYSMEKRYIHKDGSVVWVNLTVAGVRDDSGKLERFISVVEDITERRKAEEAQFRLGAIVESSDDAIVSKKLDGVITSWNAAATRIFGFTAEEAIGRSITIIIPPDLQGEEATILSRLRRGERIEHYETVRVTKAGRKLNVSLTISPLRDSKGHIIGASKVARDITDRKQGEQSRNLLAAIVDSSDDAIVSKSLDGIITSWNTSAERIFGYTAEEAVGQHITLIIPPERHAEESDILDRLRRGERIEHFHTIRRRKDGTLLDASLTISPVRDSSGRIIGASKVARDVTEQKRIERELLESEQRFRVITDASPIMVWMSGTDKLCYYFNKGWLDFVGRTLEQESGNGWAENVHPEDFDRCLRIYVNNFDARRPFEMEYRMRHHTGQYRWILDRGVPRYAADGTFEGFVGGCLDIHSQKEAAEKARIADQTIRLLKVQDEERRRIARELHDSAGQTLTVLGLSLAQLVQNAEIIAPELAKEGKQVEEVVQQLHREIRTTSYLLHPPLLDECGLVSALKWYVEGLAKRSGIAIKLDISDNFGRLSTDMELAIFRLVQECLTNIHRHSGSKRADIRMFVEAESVHVEVSDQGKGISPERLAEIRSGGSGVGIRGMQERLRQFGGEINIESNGSGTSVIVIIPSAKKVRATEAEPFQAAV
ncbi:MAG: PAS domain S-box protein [Candidatus Sulfotelmatobacter sp.]